MHTLVGQMHTRVVGQMHVTCHTVDAGYKNIGYKNMLDIRRPVIRTLPRFTESFVFYPIESVTDIRTLYWQMVTYIPVHFMPVIRTPDLRTFRI